MNIIVILAIGLILSACGVEQVDEGYRGVKTHWGKVTGEPLTPDLYFYNPISSDIMELSVLEEKMEGTEQAFTKDNQNVTINYTVSFYPEPTKIGLLYSQYGKGWEAKIVKPIVVDNLKNAIGQESADMLVQQREAARKKAETLITTKLKEKDVNLGSLSITNLDFEDTYEKAAEAKVTAIQLAEAEKNKTAQIQEQAKQTVATAEAEARAMKIKSDALSQNKSLVQYEAVQRWDGSLPKLIMGGSSIPMIDMKNLMEDSK